MEWYWWVICYAFLGSLFLVAVLGEQLGGWGILICISIAAFGFCAMKFHWLPHDEDKYGPDQYLKKFKK